MKLGCGSLILIALIVAVCSGGGGLSTRIDRLDANMQNLQRRIDELNKSLDKLSEKR